MYYTKLEIMKTKDLEHLSNKDLKKIFTEEDYKKLPSPAKEFIALGKDNFTIGTKFNRVERIAMQVVVRRFIDGKIK